VLFLAAGSVIIALHHEQDMRKMGALRKAMPVTYWTLLLAAISSAGIPGFDEHHPPHESPPVVTVPLVLLAIPSVFAGYLVGHVVFGDYFGESLPAPDPNYFGILEFVEHGFTGLPFWLALAGIPTAWYCYLKNTEMPARVARLFG